YVWPGSLTEWKIRMTPLVLRSMRSVLPALVILPLARTTLPGPQPAMGRTRRTTAIHKRRMVRGLWTDKVIWARPPNWAMHVRGEVILGVQLDGNFARSMSSSDLFTSITIGVDFSEYFALNWSAV